MLRIYTSQLLENVLLYKQCSNFNYKPQVKSRQTHLALYSDRHLRSVAIMIEVTSRHMECTRFKLDYSRMLAVALQWSPRKEATSSPI